VADLASPSHHSRDMLFRPAEYTFCSVHRIYLSPWMLTLEAFMVLALRLPHMAELPHSALKPLALKLPHIAELPHKAELPPTPAWLPTKASLPQTLKLPHIAELPQSAEESATKYTLPVTSSYAAVGDFALSVAKLVSDNAACMSR